MSHRAGHGETSYFQTFGDTKYLKFINLHKSLSLGFYLWKEVLNVGTHGQYGQNLSSTSEDLV